jgi:hypothetical protein
LDVQQQLTKYESDTARLQNQISILQNKLTSVQNDLRSEKATVSQLREKSEQEDLGELSYTNAFIDLEEVCTYSTVIIVLFYPVFISVHSCLFFSHPS